MAFTLDLEPPMPAKGQLEIENQIMPLLCFQLPIGFYHTQNKTQSHYHSSIWFDLATLPRPLYHLLTALKIHWLPWCALNMSTISYSRAQTCPPGLLPEFPTPVAIHFCLTCHPAGNYLFWKYSTTVTLCSLTHSSLSRYFDLFVYCFSSTECKLSEIKDYSVHHFIPRS